MSCFVSLSEGLSAVGFTSKNPEELLRLAWCGHRSTVSVLCGIRGDALSMESCDWRHPREQRGCRRQLPRGRGRISTSGGGALLRQKQCWLQAPGWRNPAATRMLLDYNLLLQSGERNVTKVVFGDLLCIIVEVRHHCSFCAITVCGFTRCKRSPSFMVIPDDVTFFWWNQGNFVLVVSFWLFGGEWPEYSF